jgi:hypothetical protein
VGSVHCEPREGMGAVDAVHHRPCLRLMHRTPVVHHESAAVDSGPIGAQQCHVAHPITTRVWPRPSPTRFNLALTQAHPVQSRPGSMVNH